MPLKKLYKAPVLSIKDFSEKRNRVLIVRESRGIGDILMHRMLFENFKLAMPEVNLTFACKKEYLSLCKNHPFLDKIISLGEINYSDYMLSYNTSNCCIAYESMKLREIDKSRVEIWADHCGLELKTYNMFPYFIQESLVNRAKIRIGKMKGMSGFTAKCPTVFFCPIGFEAMRSLTGQQIEEIVKYLFKNRVFVYSCYHKKSHLLSNTKMPVIYSNDMETWLSLIQAADYVISVDTATFHYAGGLKKPLVGIFSYIDGKYRGKHYDFILVQKRRDNCSWPCDGPCYNWTLCNHPKCKNKGMIEGHKPCITELSTKDFIDGIEKMFQKWPKNTILT